MGPMSSEFDEYGQMDHGNENTTHPWLDYSGKPRKIPSEIGRHRDLNTGPPEYESSVLLLHHLARRVKYSVN